jgi:hypothetical protein
MTDEGFVKVVGDVDPRLRPYTFPVLRFMEDRLRPLADRFERPPEVDFWLEPRVGYAGYWNVGVARVRALAKVKNEDLWRALARTHGEAVRLRERDGLTALPRAWNDHNNRVLEWEVLFGRWAVGRGFEV